jgi:hypothetical protein
VIGEYVGKIYLETKQRPLYTVQEAIGFSKGGKPDLQIISVEQQKSKTA